MMLRRPLHLLVTLLIISVVFAAAVMVPQAVLNEHAERSALLWQEEVLSAFDPTLSDAEASAWRGSRALVNVGGYISTLEHIEHFEFERPFYAGSPLLAPATICLRVTAQRRSRIEAWSLVDSHVEVRSQPPQLAATTTAYPWPIVRWAPLFPWLCLLVLVPGTLRDWRRLARGQCIFCAYPLPPAGRCPECGRSRPPCPGVRTDPSATRAVDPSRERPHPATSHGLRPAHRHDQTAFRSGPAHR